MAVVTFYCDPETGRPDWATVAPDRSSARGDAAPLSDDTQALTDLAEKVREAIEGGIDVFVAANGHRVEVVR